MIRHQTIALILLAFAVSACAYGVLFYASTAMPYPDPTPELLRLQEERLRFAIALVLGSAMAGVLCAVWLWRLRAKGGVACAK